MHEDEEDWLLGGLLYGVETEYFDYEGVGVLDEVVEVVPDHNISVECIGNISIACSVWFCLLLEKIYSHFQIADTDHRETEIHLLQHFQEGLHGPPGFRFEEKSLVVGEEEVMFAAGVGHVSEHCKSLRPLGH